VSEQPGYYIISPRGDTGKRTEKSVCLFVCLFESCVSCMSIWYGRRPMPARNCNASIPLARVEVYSSIHWGSGLAQFPSFGFVRVDASVHQKAFVLCADFGRSLTIIFNGTVPPSGAPCNPPLASRDR
jgi:hypothetical protein